MFDDHNNNLFTVSTTVRKLGADDLHDPDRDNNSPRSLSVESSILSVVDDYFIVKSYEKKKVKAMSRSRP